MVQLEKILSLISSQSWQGLTLCFDQMITKNVQNQDEKNWLDEYSEEKNIIISQLDKKLEYLSLTSIESQKSQNLSMFQETTIKLFAKGLILPELNHYEDVNFLNKLISTSKNSKYLFMLYQENIFEIQQIYQSQSISILDKINLKVFSIIPAFIKLIGQNIFTDILKRFYQFYESYRKISSQQNVIGEPDKQLVDFFDDFIGRTLKELHKIIGKNLGKELQKRLQEKQVQRRQLFELLKLLFTNHPNNSNQIQNLVNDLVIKLQFGLNNFQEIPSFWISSNIQSLSKVYNNQNLLFVIGSILIRQLPSRPEYSQIPTHLFNLLQWTVINLLNRNYPINSLALRNNNLFFVQIFQRFSILMGLLNNSNQNQKQINQFIKALLNKKCLFSSMILVETLWRKLIISHQDINFQIFCLNHYKKVFLLPIKQATPVQMHILINGSEFILQLVSSLQGNSNAEFIGFILTLLIYYFSFLKKINNLSTFQFNKSKENQNEENKALIVMKYVFSPAKMSLIKQQIQGKLLKLKQSLKDRLEVYKMKNTNQQQDSSQIQKQANQISICVYRIEEQIKFD